MKTAYLTLLSLMMIGLVFHFSANQVAAFSDEPCSSVNYNCDDCSDCVKPQVGMLVTDPATGWTIKLESVTGPDSQGYYDYLYKITSTPGGDTASGLNFVAMLIPECCVSPKILIDIDSSDPFNDYPPPGVGETTLGFGKYVTFARVVQGESDNTTDWHLFANTNKLTLSTAIIKLKKDAITFEIPVPGCTPPPAEKSVGLSISSSTYICTNVDTNPDYPISMSYYRDPETDYAIPESVRFYRVLDCDGEPQSPEIDYPFPLVYCTGGTDNKLNECIRLTSESPGCVNYYIGAALCTWCW